ncbi:MAG: hypothetical protein ABSG54_04885 [Terriglobia bacterium]|jgi:hypothetical protein
MLRTLRRLLRWKYYTVIIPVLWGTGIAMVCLSPSLASLRIGVGFAFVLANIIFVASFIWSLGHWLTSDTLLKKNPDTGERNRKRSAIGRQQKTYLCWKWGVSSGIFILFAASLGLSRYIEHRVELSSPHGWLIPASDPTPPAGPCGPTPNNALMLFMGDSEVIAQTFPHTLLRVNGKDVIVLHKKEDGSVALSMDVLSADGKVIARIEKNEFTVNVNNVLRWRRTDLSTLWVEDQNGNQVLKARYLNQKAIKVEAVLNLPGVPTVYGPLEFRGGEINRCFLDTGSIEVRTDR